MRRGEATWRLGLALSALLPAGLLLALILAHAVDVPFWDQWGTARFFGEAARGTLTPANLFSPQNEYRQFFPHLVFVVLGRLTGWDVRAEMLLSFLLACLVCLCVHRLGKITVGGGARQRLLPFLASCLLIFSPVQYENWLFGIQVVYFVPVLCVAACLVVASSGLGARIKILLCMLLATVATFSSANGILCWLVAPPALAASFAPGEVGSGARRRWAAAWAAGLALNAALYLHGLGRPEGSPAALPSPPDALAYFFAFLGGPFALGPRPLAVALAAGAALCALYAAAALYVWRRRDAALARRAAAWLMLGAFSVMTAALVTAGRAGFGVTQALSSRYTTFALYLAVALAHLAPLALEELRARGRAGWARAGARLAAGAALCLALAHPLVTALVVKHGMRPTRRERLHMKACVMFSSVVEDECASLLTTEPPLMRREAAELDRLGYLRPPLARSARLGELAHGTPARGEFASLERAGDGRLVAAGRALLPGDGRPADAVLLAYEDGGSGPIVFALAEVGGPDAGAPDGWRKSLSLGRLPSARITISAYAFDSLEGKAFKLDGTHDAP